MTARRNDITELELLALVEGDDDVLTDDRREALLADSTVVRLVAKLSADRAQLAALPRTQVAPAGLVTSAIERAEREALAALAAAEPVGGTPMRSSTTVVERPSVLARLFQTNWPGRLAAAAGIAIGVLGVYFTATALIDWNATKPVSVALNPLKPAPTPTTAPDTGHSAPAPTAIAAAPEASSAPTSSPTISIANGPIDVATAVSLVPQGRVVIVLHADDPQKTLTALGVASQRRNAVAAWQPLTPGTPEFAGALAAAKGSGFDFAGAASPAIALVSLGATATSFESLMATLRTDEQGGAAPQWAAVDRATLKAAHDRASMLALQPHRVLWWEQGSTAWTPPAVVPVVILPSK